MPPVKKIEVAQTGEQEFELRLDDMRATMGRPQLKGLLLQLTEALMPGSGLSQKALQANLKWLAKLETVDNPGMQALIAEVDPDDLLVMLKLTEDNAAFQKKVFDNMSANKAKMCREDLEFRMAEPPPDYAANLAVERVMVIARRLEQNDRLHFG